MNNISERPITEIPVGKATESGDELEALRERAIRVATEEAMSPNFQGTAFVEFVRAELALLDRTINGEPGTSAEDLEARLRDLTETFGAAEVEADSVYPHWVRRLLSIRHAILRHWERIAREREVRDLKKSIAAAYAREEFRRTWIAERLRLIATVYELQKRRALAAIRVARAASSASDTLKITNENTITEERHDNEQNRIYAVC